MPLISESLTSLDDFAGGAPFESGQSLVYNGQTWSNGAVYLLQFKDVSVSSPDVSQMLSYDGIKWINVSKLLSTITDVSFVSPPDKNQVLRYNGTRWVNAHASLSTLFDVTFATTPQTGEMLTYDTGAWKNIAPQLVVASGGTGATSIGARRVVCGGVTDTGSFQTVPPGSSGQYFKCNGVGALPMFVNPMRVNVLTFTTNGTYLPTAGMVVCTVEMLGGGGGGGGAPVGSSAEGSAGGGGGAGEYVKATFNEAVIGASASVVIGQGGSGRTGIGQANSGGNTVFGPSTLVAHGGVGGTGSAVSTGAVVGAAGNGGSGGVSSGSVFYAAGQPGMLGVFLIGKIAFAGFGGSSTYGAGGVGVINTANNGGSGLGYGSGGGGVTSRVPTGIATTGGNGASGVVVITEYILPT